MTDKVGGFGEQKPPWMYTDLSVIKPQTKEHPSWWLTQADIDKFEPKPLTMWQRFWAWWRNK